MFLFRFLDSVADRRRGRGSMPAALGVIALIVLIHPSIVRAQSPAPATSARQAQGAQPPSITFQLPPVIVSAQKEPADAQGLPVSVTAISSGTMDNAGLQTVGEAAIYAPNTHFSEFTARKLSNARFRGIGSSPANPSITTYFDGVPQLNANSSSIDLMQVDQIELVRGSQSALFGRNALGGVINVTSRRPSVGGDWRGSVTAPFANRNERGIRAEASGPVAGNTLGAGVAFAYGERDGFTLNTVTGNDLDRRSSYAGKAQLLWTPASRWEARVIVSGERDRDGDYGLSDLGGLRSNPFQAARDFEGFTERDVMSTTVLTRWEGARVAVSTTSGFVRWRTEDATDLDYLPFPLLTRTNREESFQFTQEVRLASAANTPIRLSDAVTLRWQTGVFLFTQDYEQDAANTFAPAVLSQIAQVPIDFPVTQRSPQSELDDVGVGVYGQGTLTLASRLDLIAGIRADREGKSAVLNTFSTPPFFPPTSVVEERDFSDVSPQFAAAMRVLPGKTVYGSVSRGFKAGGFNPASPIGSEAYGEEHTWSLEGGVKTTWAGGRVMANASVFRIDWEELQLNLPDPFAPGQFFIDNAAAAVSSGAEVEVNARALQGVDVFGSAGITRARFDDDVVLGGSGVGGNEIPNTPDFTATIGAQLTHIIGPDLTVYGRAEATTHGAYHYDERNTESQDTYSLANFRVGVRVRQLVVEGWIRNAFDTRYIPIAFEYRNFAPSGFIGEMGKPRTFGINVGVAF